MTRECGLMLTLEQLTRGCNDAKNLLVWKMVSEHRVSRVYPHRRFRLQTVQHVHTASDCVYTVYTYTSRSLPLCRG